MTGKSYAQNDNKKKDNTMNTKRVSFLDGTTENNGLEKHHNLLMSTSPNPSEDTEYTTVRAPVIAHVMYQLHQEAIIHGTSFGQQYILQVGLKRFGEQGHAAALKELEQMYKSCLLYTSPSPRDGATSRMPSSA